MTSNNITDSNTAEGRRGIACATGRKAIPAAKEEGFRDQEEDKENSLDTGNASDSRGVSGEKDTSDIGDRKR